MTGDEDCQLALAVRSCAWLPGGQQRSGTLPGTRWLPGRLYPPPDRLPAHRRSACAASAGAHSPPLPPAPPITAGLPAPPAQVPGRLLCAPGRPRGRHRLLRGWPSAGRACFRLVGGAGAAGCGQRGRWRRSSGATRPLLAVLHPPPVQASARTAACCASWRCRAWSGRGWRSTAPPTPPPCAAAAARCRRPAAESRRVTASGDAGAGLRAADGGARAALPAAGAAACQPAHALARICVETPPPLWRACLPPTQVLVIPTDEQLEIARETVAVARRAAPHLLPAQAA